MAEITWGGARRRAALQGLAAAVTTIGCWAPVQADAWPGGRPVKIIVPFAPGAGTDAMGRLVATKMADLLKTTVVVENKTGASGAIGAVEVAKAAPDGHTLLLAAAPFTTVPAALPSAGYDPLLHFAPVGMIAQGPLVGAVNKDLPVSGLPDLIALARQRPGALNYGSAGVGGVNHLVLESLKARTGTFIVHIPYRGIAPATLDAIAGQLQLVTGTIPALAPHIREGRLKALAVTSPERSPALPQVPGMREAGMPDFNVLNYFALVAPKGTPEAVVRQINTTLAEIVQQADVKERLAKDALEPAAGTPEQLRQFLLKDFQAWQRVVQQQGLKIDAF
jgi:tripartite-type tricarboxylate transporter receptor subunit TctC